VKLAPTSQIRLASWIATRALCVPVLPTARPEAGEHASQSMRYTFGTTGSQLHAYIRAPGRCAASLVPVQRRGRIRGTASTPLTAPVQRAVPSEAPAITAYADWDPTVDSDHRARARARLRHRPVRRSPSPCHDGSESRIDS